MKVVMIGAGYVGLTTGGCLAELGHDVCCCDVDEAKLAMLRAGTLPIYEPGLAELIAANRQNGRLSFSNDLSTAVPGADFVFIAVGTPSDANGDIDLTYVEQAACDIAPFLRPDAVVVLKSTVVAGTARRIHALIADNRKGSPVAVASNPEFLREGSAVADFMSADRIVVGADDEISARRLSLLYAPLVKKDVPFIQTTTVNAELTKYAANAFLALKIGFINDVANLCEAADGDVSAVAEGIGLDRRIGTAFLSPGPGFGGSCFPKDTRAFAATGRRFGMVQSLVERLIENNEERKRALAERILNELALAHKDPSASRIAILGAAFKANTDDVREAAALTLVPLLQQAGAFVHAHDPKARVTAEPLLPEVVWHETPYEAAKDADVVVILTEWEEYRALDLKRLASLMRGRGIVDYRNLLDGRAVTECGLHYVSLGRAREVPSAEFRRGGTGSARWTDLAASPA